MPGNSRHLKFVDAVKAYSHVKLFEVASQGSGDPWEWRLRPLDVEVLSDDDRGGGHYIVAALRVAADQAPIPCFMDMTLPERVNNHAFFIDGPNLTAIDPRRFRDRIIPATALDCFGQYETFYVESSPETGIRILKRGLEKCKRKRFIALDLAYIYRDEKRYREAAEMFELVVSEEAPSVFIFDELAQLYKKLGDKEKQAKYQALGDRG